MPDKSAPERVDPDEIDEVDPGGGNDSLGQRIDRDTELAEDLAEESEDQDEAARRFEREKEGARPEDLPTEQRP
ncbi:MAG TPA: hypothetical protein VFN21_00010 [Acidimicrobiales bacterium]|nr:hypothetical protein [Acidimicrobiales bacterium]